MVELTSPGRGGAPGEGAPSVGGVEDQPLDRRRQAPVGVGVHVDPVQLLPAVAQQGDEPRHRSGHGDRLPHAELGAGVGLYERRGVLELLRRHPHDDGRDALGAVSYTHLTLPTNREV